MAVTCTSLDVLFAKDYVLSAGQVTGRKIGLRGDECSYHALHVNLFFIPLLPRYILCKIFVSSAVNLGSVYIFRHCAVSVPSVCQRAVKSYDLGALSTRVAHSKVANVGNRLQLKVLTKQCGG